MQALELLSQEWQTLQTHHEQHEKNALLIKLVCIAVVTLGLGMQIPPGWLVVCTLLLWGQEAIFKTYQSRLASRLLQVEALLAQPAPPQSTTPLPAMQLHTTWAAHRPGTAGLVASYALSACKPTVAYPYVPLLAAALFLSEIGL